MEEQSTSILHCSDNEMSEDENIDQCESDASNVPEKDFSSRNMMKFPTVARECDRYGVSNTAGAAIATAALTDYGVIIEGDTNLVIDRKKGTIDLY
jgi:hypothetical protein